MKYIYLFALSAIFALSGITTSNANLARQPWVKICNSKKLINGSPFCIVMHDNIGKRYGGSRFRIAVSKVDGRRNVFFLTFPKGYDFSRGAHFRIDKNKPLSLFRFKCKKRRCTASAIMTSKLMGQLKRGKKITVLVFKSGRVAGTSVTLKGFTAAYNGSPVSSRAYAIARRRETRKIQDRNGIIAPPTTFDDIFSSF